MGEKYNINEQDDLHILQQAMNSEHGKTIYEFIFQRLNEEFNEDMIDVDKMSYEEIGEQFKTIKKVRNVQKNIDNLFFNNNSGQDKGADPLL